MSILRVPAQGKELFRLPPDFPCVLRVIAGSYTLPADKSPPSCGLGVVVNFVYENNIFPKGSPLPHHPLAPGHTPNLHLLSQCEDPRWDAGRPARIQNNPPHCARRQMLHTLSRLDLHLKQCHEGMLLDHTEDGAAIFRLHLKVQETWTC